MENQNSETQTQTQTSPTLEEPKPPQSLNTYPCPSCGKPVDVNSYFCPNCGKKLKDPPPSTTIGKQIYLYLFALLVPPFGIVPAIKYLRAQNHTAKVIGYFLIIISIISFTVAVWATFATIDQINKTINQQLNQVQYPGL